MSIVWASGMKLTPARLNALNPVEAVKAGDTPRSSNITLTADPDLTVTIPATSATYELTAHLFATSAANAAGDIQYDWTYPTGATLTWGAAGPHNTLASGSQADGEWTAVMLDGSSPSGAIPYGASQAGAGTLVIGRLVVGSTGGNLTLRWAQQSSNASATVLKAGSYIRIRRTG